MLTRHWAHFRDVSPALRQRALPWHALMILALGVVFLATHLLFLPSMPASIDSVNFLLGVRGFDVADHRPHPPGAPVFIALGKVSAAVTSAGVSVEDGVRGLAVWSAVCGALAVIPLFVIFRRLEHDNRRAVAAVALTLTCPLFWFVALRPLSDMTGLVFSLGVQALALTGWRCSDRRYGSRLLVLGALGAGLAVGIRVQAVWITLPVLILNVTMDAGTQTRWRAAMAFAAGVLIWAVPLVLISGGLDAYLTVLMRQGREDLEGAQILATHWTTDELRRALVLTFAYPWAHTLLAATILGLGVSGAVAMLRYSPRALVWVAAAIVPYALFHLLFQETAHTRYALPLVPALAYLAVRGLDALTPRLMPWVVTSISAAGIVVVAPAMPAHAGSESPAYRAVLDIAARVTRDRPMVVLGMHHSIARLLRGQPLPLPSLTTTPKREWLGLAEYWQRHPDGRVWFLAESGRGDLARIDPASRRLIRAYDWPFRRKYLMGRVPADRLEWWDLQPPGWIAMNGWSLSPEVAGLTDLENGNRRQQSAVAFVRRRSGGATLMIGGRRSRSDSPTARMELSLQGERLDSWTLPRDAASFLRMWSLPAGALESRSPFVQVRIDIAPEETTETRPSGVHIDQFDLQSMGASIWGYDLGWYQREYDGSADPWRWMGAVGTLRIAQADRELRLRARVETLGAHVDDTPRLSVRAGNEILKTLELSERMTVLDVRVAADGLARAGGIVTIETDRTFVPDFALGNGDRRTLGLRVYELTVSPSELPSGLP